MTAENNPAQEFYIHKVYLKDASFESPNSPLVFKSPDIRPEITVNVDAAGDRIDPDTYEVVVTVTATAKQNAKTLFLAEVKQAGIFTLKGFGDPELNGMIGAYCPETLFPFAREAIAELVAKGGFPQLLLSPVNFNALYMQRLQQAQAGAAGQG